MDYLDFEIQVEGNGPDYTVTVLRSPAGEVRETVRFPYGQLELENQLLTLQNVLLQSGGVRRSTPTEQERSVQGFGQSLFDFLFTREVYSLYRKSQSQAEQVGVGLRLKLHLLNPRLNSLPWEYLYDRNLGEYISLSTQTPLIRYLNLTRTVRPLAVDPPLRILAMVANPKGLPPLDVESEQERLNRALAELTANGLVELHWLQGQRWQDLQRAMRRGPWHIFHFVGHGAFDALRDEGLIMLADDRGDPFALTATALGRLLANHRSLRLAVLNACEGAMGGTLDIYSSTASILMRRGLPSVVAMQYAITDYAAIEFTTAFYEWLAVNAPIDLAVTEARVAVSVGIANSLEWGTPVLHMRAPDGAVFAVQALPDTDLTTWPRPAAFPPKPSPDPSPLQNDGSTTSSDVTIDEPIEQARESGVNKAPVDPEVAKDEIIEPLSMKRERDFSPETPPGLVAIKRVPRRKYLLYGGVILVVVVLIAFSVWAGREYNARAIATEGAIATQEAIRVTATQGAIATAISARATVIALTPVPPPKYSGAQPPASATVGDTWENPKDNAVYVYVPPGEFIMGSEGGLSDEKPVSGVNVAGFWIMRTEVTNEQYSQCVREGPCEKPDNNRWNDDAYVDHPVANVSWYEANQYATWVGGHLPTEAEWEKACRDTEGRIYPWEGDGLTPNLLNYNNNVGDTVPVGIYPKGASLYGALDMAGNVSEWTNGLEDATVLRGGSFVSDDRFVRCAARSNLDFPNIRGWSVGFRVVSPGP